MESNKQLNSNEDLKLLVEELLKSDPSEPMIEKMMDKLGMSHTKDPIDRLQKLLQMLNFEEGKKDFL